MTDQETDYSGYTLGQLYDAKRWIDPERFPERAAAIDREILRREEEGSPEPTEAPAEERRRRKKALGRRTAAFFIDFLLFVVLWSVVEILLLERRSDLDRIFLSFLGFIIYFLITEGMFRRKASPGKRLAGLSVVRRDGAPATPVDCLVRVLLFGAVSVLAWDQLVYHLPAEGVALWILLVGVGMLRGLFLYNLFLALRDPHGRMLQDRITGTRVIDSAADLTTEEWAEPEARRQPRRWPGYLILSAFLLLSGGLYGAMYFQVKSAVGGGSWSVLDRWQERRLAGKQAIQEVLDRELELYSRADLGFRFHRSGDRETRVLTVSVWIPPRHWNPEQLDRVREGVRLPADLETKGFDRAVLVLWTGTRFIRFTRTFPLDLPDPDRPPGTPGPSTPPPP